MQTKPGHSAYATTSMAGCAVELVNEGTRSMKPHESEERKGFPQAARQADKPNKCSDTDYRQQTC